MLLLFISSSSFTLSAGRDFEGEVIFGDRSERGFAAAHLIGDIFVECVVVSDMMGEVLSGRNVCGLKRAFSRCL